MNVISIDWIRKQKRAFDVQRAQLLSFAQPVLGGAKRAIFAFHRGELKKGKALLNEAEKQIQKGKAVVKALPSLGAQGPWRAALEEYAEARMFEGFLSGRFQIKIRFVEDPDLLLGALSDTAGEIARYCVLRATAKDSSEVDRGYAVVIEIVELLAELDLTGSLRSKFDQSKQHLRKLEEIRYDLSKRA